MLQYEMEELVPIVGNLAKKYTSNESSSVSYEKAEQLMGAVLYCINELYSKTENLPDTIEQIPAESAYKMGCELVEKKVQETLKLYHVIMENFDSYENRCYYDTLVKGFPEFFKWYDIRFAPQDTILTLDYPIRKDLSQLEGVDRIYEYLKFIYLEQEYLRSFPREEIIDALSLYPLRYQDMIENVSEIFQRMIKRKEYTGGNL